MTNNTDGMLKKQECQTIEWKWNWHDDYLKWLCGYANVEGGVLNIGVNDDGYVVGVEDSKRMLEILPNKIKDKLGIIASVQIHSVKGAENIRYGNDVPDNIADKLINQYSTGKVAIDMFSPADKEYTALKKIEKENKIWEKDDKYREYISIEIMRYPFAISCDGKYYKRSGATLNELNGFELQNFLLERAGKSWDAVTIPGVSIDDLSKSAIDAFKMKAIKNGRMSEADMDISDEMLLKKLKLLDGKLLTRAAILLFHPEPEQYVTGTYIKIGLFAKKGTYDGSEIIEDLQYQDIIEGPLITQADKSIELIFSKYFKGLIDYDGIQRIDAFMLTKEIVREILLNAINHKDYSTGVPIQVSVYEDRIVVFNMGKWPKDVPVDENIYEKHHSVPHNPKIADVSFRSGDIEAWGSGFLKIKAECKRTNTELPMIDVSEDGVEISAYGSERYLKLLRYGQPQTKNDEIKHSDSSINIDLELLVRLREFLREPRTRVELQEFCGIKSRDYFRKTILIPLIESKKILLTIPDKRTSSKQRYIWNEK